MFSRQLSQTNARLFHWRANSQFSCLYTFAHTTVDPPACTRRQLNSTVFRAYNTNIARRTAVGRLVASIGAVEFAYKTKIYLIQACLRNLLLHTSASSMHSPDWHANFFSPQTWPSTPLVEFSARPHVSGDSSLESSQSD